ncbi:hypothetical protein IAT38_001596 [Cryptococcus sp. DSM 104549]
MESVTLPSRRSRLGLDKTASGENETLLGKGTAVKQEVDEDGDELMNGDETEEEDWSQPGVNGNSPVSAKGKGKGKAAPAKGKGKAKAVEKPTPAHQPFNIGKHSRVTKADASDLQLPTPVTASGRPKRTSVSKAKTIKDEPSASEDEDDEKDGDYAMDSDEEAKQLERAIEASTGGDVTPVSPAGSSGSTKGKGKRNNQAALRTAVARAAEKRLQQGGASTPASGGSRTRNTSGTNTPASNAATDMTPLSDDDDFEDPETESELSALEDSEDDVPLAGGRGRGGARGRGATRGARGGRGGRGAAAGRTKKFQGKGRALGGDDDEANPDDDDDGDFSDSAEEEAFESEDELSDPNLTDLQRLHVRKRREQRREAKEAAPRKKRERALSKKLGRKLTNGEKNLVALCMNHPELEDVWGDLQATIEPIKPVMMEAHPSLKLTLLPFQKESLYWMKKQEEGPWKGGMLADEMGMGKTIQTIALLLSEPRRKPSLVVAPVVALMQWKNEIETHAEGFTVCLWHGQGRMKAAELKKYDVVLCSYGTLEASFRRQQRGFKRGDKFIKEKSPMHEFEWFRVILDEAHNIKERSTNAAKAAFALHATYKWCLSGTPLQNRVGELYSLVRFLGADPFSHYFCKKCDCKSLHWQFSDKRSCDQCGHTPMAHVCFWNTEILTPIARYGIVEGGPGHTAFKKLKILLDRMMLRRTKLERADDLGLPPRTIVVRRDFFSPQEKELYMSLFTNAKRTFATYIDQGTVLNNYSNIFSLITRMRQMACHPDLVLRSKNSTVGEIKEGTVCRLCNDTAEDAIMSSCKHVFDRECIRQYLEVKQARGHKPECPVCHIEISIDLEAEALDLEEDNRKARQGILSRLNLENWRSSSKLEALVEELEKLRNQDCTIKSLVFSQFVSFLDLIAFRLQRAGFNICRLEGGMTPQQRDATIQHFMKNTGVTVFLISLKAGGVALNLTEASMVFMMDSWWNPSVEYQAMDRIHRLGQKRPVKVIKLVIEDSIEDQIVQLQAKKLAMTEAALSSDADAALGKLTVEDLGFLFKL